MVYILFVAKHFDEYEIEKARYYVQIFTRNPSKDVLWKYQCVLNSINRNTAVTKELKHDAQARANGQFNVSSCPKYSFAAQFTTPINVKKAEIIKIIC